jgi:hypothetical protein
MEHGRIREDKNKRRSSKKAKVTRYMVVMHMEEALFGV